MKHLSKYIDFKLNEGWLSDRLSNSSEGVKTALSDFAKPFEDIAKKVKGEWKEEFDSDKVRNELSDSLSKSFEDMIKSIDEMGNKEDVQAIYDEIDQALVQFNDQLGKEIDNMAVKESIKSYRSFFSINESNKSIMAGLKAAIDGVIQQAKDKLNDSREDFLEIFNEDEKDKEPKFLDTMKEEAKEFFKKISKDIESDIKSLDIKTIVDDAKAKVENSKTKEGRGIEDYKPGTILKYTKKDGDENVAEVANNQENVEDGYINMIAKDGKEKFVIPLDRVIGVADEKGDVEVTPEDISNSLEDIKGDKKKMNKLKKFIDKELS